MKILLADQILPISSEPFENGAIAIEKDTIIAVGKTSEVTKKFPAAEVKDFGETVLMPGFVNCHAHLELTVMRGFLDVFDGDFFSWLITLTKTRAEKLSAEDIHLSALLGALEGARAGVTCFADIGRQGRAGLEALKKNGLRGIVYQETGFSPADTTAREDFQKLKEKFLELKEAETPLVAAGLSPHAPYTVSRRLFEEITDFALAEDIRLTIHAAESPDEVEFMKTGRGFFADIFERAGINWRAPELSPIGYLEKTGVLRTRPLLAHCVRVSVEDIQIIAKSGATIAHCPKSNAKFGHGIAPLGQFFDKNIWVGLGSDSVASNNICDLLEEARFAALLARTRPGKKRFLTAEEMIKTATIGGARALGLENSIGTLEAGKQADIIAVSLTNPAQMPVQDIYAALLFASNARDVKMTMVAGEEIYRDGVARRVDEIELKSKIREVAGKMRG